MFFLLPILLFAALFVNTLASPQIYTWPLRARSDSGPIRARKEEFQIRSRQDSSSRNFSLPLPRRDDSSPHERRDESTPSPLSPRNFLFPLQAREKSSSKTGSEHRDEDLLDTSSIGTGPVRPRDAFAIRPRIRPRKSEPALQPLALRQANSSAGFGVESNSSLPGFASPNLTNPGFDAKVLSITGVDITSNFTIMFYHSPSIVALDSLNDKHRKRQTGLAIPQNKCRSPTAVFSFSHCTPKGSIDGTTRTFQVFCRERSQGLPSHRQSSGQGSNPWSTKYVSGRPSRYYQKPRAEPPGMCDEDQMCQDTEADWPGGTPEERRKYGTAMCVSKRNYKQLPSVANLAELSRVASGDAESSGLDGRLSMVVSDTTGETPLEAAMEVDAGVAGPDGTVQRQSCEECLELRPEEFPADTNSVSVRARVLETLAVGGILWLAFFHN